MYVFCIYFGYILVYFTKFAYPYRGLTQVLVPCDPSRYVINHADFNRNPGCFYSKYVFFYGFPIVVMLFLIHFISTLVDVVLTYIKISNFRLSYATYLKKPKYIYDYFYDFNYISVF